MFYVQIDGEERGPVTAQQLKAFAEKKIIERDDLVRKSDGGNWRPAHMVKGLFDEVSPLRRPDSIDRPVRPPIPASVHESSRTTRIAPPLSTLAFALLAASWNIVRNGLAAAWRTLTEALRGISKQCSLLSDRTEVFPMQPKSRWMSAAIGGCVVLAVFLRLGHLFWQESTLWNLQERGAKCTPMYGMIEDRRPTRVDELRDWIGDTVGRKWVLPLNVVIIHGEEFGSEECELLLRLSALEYVNISGTGVDDSGFLRLAKLARLKEIQIYNTAVSSDAEDEFRRLCPDVDIRR